MSGLPGVQRRAQVEEKMRGNRKTNARAGGIQRNLTPGERTAPVQAKKDQVLRCRAVHCALVGENFFFA